jgi:hypothetical protein
MIDLSKATCPILDMLRRRLQISRTEPAKKEPSPSTLRVTSPNLADVYKEPDETLGQIVVHEYRGF